MLKPTAGEVLWQGKPVVGPAPGVAMVFQSFALFPWLTVQENVELGLEAGGTFVAINNKISQSVPHLHVHVVPRRRKDGLRGFFWPRLRYADDAEAAAVAARIAGALG